MHPHRPFDLRIMVHRLAMHGFTISIASLEVCLPRHKHLRLGAPAAVHLHDAQAPVSSPLRQGSRSKHPVRVTRSRPRQKACLPTPVGGARRAEQRNLKSELCPTLAVKMTFGGASACGAKATNAWSRRTTSPWHTAIANSCKILDGPSSSLRQLQAEVDHSDQVRPHRHSQANHVVRRLTAVFAVAVGITFCIGQDGFPVLRKASLISAP
eukprot:TRINITY_DN22057_c0_g1_i4.p2 TRINITY_DN22057_c0_g1~~TRINITY_DN22057_c0_g1_i4.p2  ORF type:complete len:211 (+),score=3.45 TRINITY_DN22057_c0_g1_i4:232-864(+)